MVNFKNAIALGLLASTATATGLKNDKRHVHHRRSKIPCSTVDAPFPVGNSTQPAGTGAATTSIEPTSSVPVITYTVVPVPISPTSTSVEQSPAVSQPVPVNSGPAVVSTIGQGSACGPAATTYVTVQQTVTVTAGHIPASSSSSSSIPVVVAPQPTTTSKAAPAPVPTSTSVAVQQPQPEQSSTPPPASTGSSSSPPVTAPQGSYSGTKLGIAWDPSQNYDYNSIGLSSGVNWAYDWGQLPHGVSNGVEYVPTLHDASKCPTFGSDLKTSGATFAKHFNEPDNAGYGASNIPVSTAAQLHDQYIKPLMSSHSIGLPAVTSNNGPGSGVNWLSGFIDAVGGCQGFAFGDFHFYGGAGETAQSQAQTFLGYVDNWISFLDEKCPGQNLPIWVSEVSALPVGDSQMANDFMNTVAPQLENNPRVARYAYWFPANNQIQDTVSSIVSDLLKLA